MKQNLLKDTPAYQFGVRPAVQSRDMSKVMLPDVVKSLIQFMNAGDFYTYHHPKDKSKVEGSSPSLEAEKPLGHPERDAVVFYMMNHAVSVVRQRVHPMEPLGKYLPLVEEYHRQLAARSCRMFFYLLLICTREARHEKGGSKMEGLYQQYGSVIGDFHKLHLGESGVLEKLKKDPPKVQIGPFTSFLSDQFYKGSYNSGYGGKAWGKVADVLRDFVHGKLTAEMMLDTSFTLCHNNGPIFNKGMLFDHYSDQIYRILDIQRSGQIPQAVADNETQWASDPVVKKLYQMSLDVLGHEFIGNGYVDWYAVEGLGSLKKYPNEKAKQKIKHGAPDGSTESSVAMKPEKAKAAQKPKGPLTSLEILPGVFVHKSKTRPTND